ncbi:MAG: glycosyltransferase [Candidatus Limnocylindria bacterium]
MPNATGLDERMASAVDRIGRAEILVGIPSYRNAGTVGHVARSVAEGLRRHFPRALAVVVNSDGGSDDGTRDRVGESLDGVPHVVGTYVGLPGKGSAFRAIFEAAARLGVRACAVVDSDLRSITPDWVSRLLGPIVEGRADYVTPLYARHKHDGTITNTIAYPLTRALYGRRVRQPIGGEFGFSGELARAFQEGGALGDTGVWDTDVARFGIDIYMTTTALARGARIGQAFLGAKVHDPKDPGADLAPMFTQVVGTAFRLAARSDSAWSGVSGSEEAPVFGEVTPVDPEEVRADSALLVRKLRAAAAGEAETWDRALSPVSREAVTRALGEDVPHALAGAAWARIVYDLLAASAGDPERTDAYVRSLVPLYFGRVAAFIDDARDMTTAGSERLVEEQAAAFEGAKGHLRERWTTARR